MSSRRGNSSGFKSSSVRPSSAKARGTSTNKGTLSSRSNASVDSDLSDLSVTGTNKVAKRTYRKKEVRSSHASPMAAGEGSSDSDQPRSKHYDINSKDNLRYSGNTPKKKKELALSFKNKPSPRSPISKQHPGEDVDDWWPGANHIPKVPPLQDLDSPTDKKPINWFTSSTDAANLSKTYSPSDPIVDVINEMLNSPGDGKSGASSSERELKQSPVPKLRLSGSLEDEKSSASQVHNNAAVMIQKHFRGWNVRRKTGKSAVKELLGQKKQAVERHSYNYLGASTDVESKDAERARKREEKARLARQAAIKELQNKREAKKVENARKAEEEIKFLQSSGVITKKKSNTTKAASKPKSSSKSNNRDSDNNRHDASKHSTREDIRPATGSSTARKLEEMFKSDGRAKPEPVSDDLSTGRTETTLENSKIDQGKQGAGGKSTFEDLLESLKQLEQEPQQDPLMMSSASAKYSNWMGDEQDMMQGKNKQHYLSEENLDQLNHQDNQSSKASTALSAEKLQNIINFLDEVEKSEEAALKEIHQTREGSISRGLPSPDASVSAAADKERQEARAQIAKQDEAFLEMASASAAEVTNQIMSLKIELEEKKRTNELLQRALNQQRDFAARQSKESEKDSNQRIAIQKQEYEATIQRHLTFIDQLIDDKKILSERCEDLLGKLKVVDKKFTDKIKLLEENHEVEMKKQKEVIMAAEKLRREKWISEKTQQIKEVTVKGLEPDIQKLIAKHKAELKKLRSSHQAELLEADERAGRRYIHQIEELREQLDREKDNAVTKERELAQQRFEKQLEQEEQAYQQQRRRLYSEVQDEKERVSMQAQKQRQEMDEAIAALEDSHKKAMNEVERTHEKAMNELQSKHEFELKEMKERLDVERQAWIENYMKKQDTILLSKERELKEGVREARDREIEMVITRLEEESAASREECERAAENRIKRIRNKYESEIKELEKSEANMQAKYNSTKERLLEVEGEVTRLRSQITQTDKQKEDVERVLEKLQEERGKVADIIRQEFADRLVTTEEDNKRLKNEVSEMRARHRLEVDRITSEKEQEMEQLHQRVKQAISKKEETMKTLREQQQAAMKRADHLEMLLQQQRKKLLP